MKVATKAQRAIKSKTIDGFKYVPYKAHSRMFIGADVKTLAGLGGVFVVFQDGEKLKQISRDKTQSIKNRLMAVMSEPGYTICVVKDVIPSFTKEEMDAVMAHEICHIVNRHLIGKTGVLVDLDKEKEADAYAAKHVSAAAMRSALIKLKNKNLDIMCGIDVANIDERIESLS